MQIYHQYQSSKKLYFQRWSNKAYAVFHSIGQEVVIGVVSKILDKLQTVKAVVIGGLDTDACKLKVEEFEEKEILPDIKLSGLFQINQLTSAPFLSNQRQSFSGSEQSDFGHIIFLIRAFFGPFLFSNYRCSTKLSVEKSIAITKREGRVDCADDQLISMCFSILSEVGLWFRQIVEMYQNTSLVAFSLIIETPIFSNNSFYHSQNKCQL